MSNSQSIWRIIAYRTLVVFFVVGMIASTTVIWANVRIQDSDAWSNTVGPLAEDPAVQEFVITQASNVIEGQITADEEFGQLRSYSRSQLMALVRMALGDFVTSPTFATWWSEANRNLHDVLMYAIDDAEGGILQKHGGNFVLDLRPAMDWVNVQLESFFPQSDYTIDPDPERLVIVLYSSDALESAIRIVKLVDTLAIILPGLTLLALVGAIAFKSHFATAITQIAISLAVGMILVLVLINIGRWLMVSQQPAAMQDVLDALIRITLVDLAMAFRTIAVVAMLRAGIVLLLQSKYVNNPRIRSFLKYHREAIVASSIFAVVIWLTLSTYPPIWQTMLALVAIVVGAYYLYRWRDGKRSTDGAL